MREFNDIKTRNELADYLKVPRKILSYKLYVQGVNNLYTSFEIGKKSGGIRKINAPEKELKDIQRKLGDALYNHKKITWGNENKVSHAFEENKSIITNAEVHRNKRFVLNIDLKDFFESFHFGRVRGYFNKNSNFLLPVNVATVIAQLSCYDGKLPQGAPTSPIISNLICEIFDHRIVKIAKKYKLDYTRYADDLTFSTNERTFPELQTKFYEELSKEVKRAGFTINENKIDLQLKDSRQSVTGLVVNKKININRIFYKKTRAMAHRLYTQGNFEIDGEPGTLNQLEGRFAFINQLTRYNNKIDGEIHNLRHLDSKEFQYQKFLFYKYFFYNPKPLILTEGKTDVAYLKAALKNLYNEYPSLITKNGDKTFEFEVSFFKKTKRLQYFLGITQQGGNSLKNIYNFFSGKENIPNHLSDLKRLSGMSPRNPVILILDNEISKDNPLKHLLKHVKLSDKKRETLNNEYWVNITDNLYLLIVPLGSGETDYEIEDLFDQSTLLHEINGRNFSRNNNFNTYKYYGKDVFSKHILNNYSSINFDGFKPFLKIIDKIIQDYTKGSLNNEYNLKTKDTKQDSKSKGLQKV